LCKYRFNKFSQALDSTIGSSSNRRTMARHPRKVFHRIAVSDGVRLAASWCACGGSIEIKGTPTMTRP